TPWRGAATCRPAATCRQTTDHRYTTSRPYTTRRLVACFGRCRLHDFAPVHSGLSRLNISRFRTNRRNQSKKDAENQMPGEIAANEPRRPSECNLHLVPFDI